MTTGVSCTVLLDGVRVADGSPGDNLSGPVALSALSVTWGRSDTMQQPEADSCSFDVMDVAGDGFSQTFRTGSRVDVVARGLIPGTDAVPTFSNPGFESADVTWTSANASAVRSSQRVQGGSNALKLSPADRSAVASAVLAPRVFSPAGTQPDAWDDIPTTELGQSWLMSLSVWVPLGASVEVRPALFSGPYANAWTPADVAPFVVTGNNTWQAVNFTYLVNQGKSSWVGIELRFFPSGPAWDSVTPSTLTWDAVDASLTWDDFGTLFIDNAQVTAPSASSGSSVLVFAGRVTELSSAWDDTADAPVLSITANGFTADLQNRRVGDEPWPVEDVETRAHRILDLSGLPVSIDIDTSLADTLLSYADVDSQGALGLLQTIATSVDGVLWPAVHSALGAYLRLEDPAMRTSLLTFQEVVTPAVERRRNRHLNPSVETAGWAVSSYGTGGAGNANRTNVGGPAVSGSYFYRATWTTASTAGSPYVTTSNSTSNHVPVVAGRTYRVSVYVRVSVARNIHVVCVGHAADGSGWSGTGGPVVAVPANTWTRLDMTWTAPTGVALLRVLVEILNQAMPVGATFDTDAVLVEEGTTLGAYFDGSTPDTATSDYAWLGTAHASASTESTPAVREIIIVEADPEIGVDISACDVLRDPVTWQQTVSDIATRASVTWKLQGVDADGLPTTTDVTETIIDTQLEQRHGTRAVSASTELQAAADAQDVAARILARTSSDAWRANGITLDDDDLTPGETNVRTLLALLNGTQRIGLPVVLKDLPQWAPAGTTAGVYLEGGSYQFVSGRWVLALTVSAADAGLGASAAWDDLDASWQWNEFDPEMTWDDLRGVSS